MRIRSVAPGVKTAAKSQSSDADTLKKCLLDRASCTDSRFKSSTDFSLDDVVNIKIVDRASVKAAPADGSSAQAAAAQAPLPSIDMEILFEYNSAEIRTDQYAQLRLLAETLAAPEFSNYTIAVIGHTDAKGSDAYNLDLSWRRANEVANAVSLLSGLPQNRMTATGLGARRLKSEADPMGPQNRRVQIVLIPRA